MAADRGEPVTLALVDAPGAAGGARRGRAAVAEPERVSEALARAVVASTARAERPGQRTAVRPRYLLSLVPAVFIGMAVSLLGPFEYDLSLLLRIEGADAVRVTPRYQAALLELAAAAFSPDRAHGTVGAAWSAEVEGDQFLRLRLRAAQRGDGVRRLTSFGGAFVERATLLRNATLTSPSPAERFLETLAAELRARLQDARDRFESTLALSANAPEPDQQQLLLERWQLLRSGYVNARTVLTDSAAELERLEQQDVPTHGVVLASERREALAGDLALQQDLRELAVHLTELKLQLLNVWQESAAPLERLVAAAEALRELLGGEAASAADAASAPTPSAGPDRHDRPGDATPFATLAAGFGSAAIAFAERWNQEFMPLRSVDIDPLAAEWIESHERARLVLNDFLFNAGKRLAAMRARVRAMEGNADPAALVRQSGLVRAFEALQGAHHRFEFAAGELDARTNRPLDVALRGAAGLRRRTQERISAIDERLSRSALERARRRYETELTRLRGDVQSARSQADRIIDDLVSLQEELNLNSRLAAELLQTALRAEHADRDVSQTRRDVERLEGHISVLAAERRATYGDTGVRVVGTTVSDWPVDLPARARRLAGTVPIVLLTLCAGQWYLHRRRVG
ncbi:MAG: hypothetical protein HY763_01195 [Planctomycetes bacterium]|nr:hypothetical protein [Planctomycetota bacterium]